MGQICREQGESSHGGAHAVTNDTRVFWQGSDTWSKNETRDDAHQHTYLQKLAVMRQRGKSQGPIAASIIATPR